MPEAKLIWPVGAPGMPPVGLDFILEAKNRGDTETQIGGTKTKPTELLGPTVEEVIRDCLYGKGEFEMNLTVRVNKRKSFQFIPGHLWGKDPQGPSQGPEPAEVMVIGKNVGDVELEWKRCQRGKPGVYMLRALNRLDVPKLNKWYVTNILKTTHLEDERGALKQSWIRSQIHLLHQEIRLVKPKFILLLGADAVKAVLGRTMTLGKMEGRVIEKEFETGLEKDEDSTHKCLIMACIHPAAVMSTPEYGDRFERSLNRFKQLVAGSRWDQDESNLDHRIIDNERDLLKVFEDAEKLCDKEGHGKIIGIDAEWEGDHPNNKESYLRSVQISWAHKAAATIVLRHAGGAYGFRRLKSTRDPKTKKVRKVLLKHGSERGCKRAMELLYEFMQDKRPAGHIFNSDLEWLIHHDCDLRDQFEAPLDWRKCINVGGLDTALMAHAFRETDDFTLTGQALRYTDAPRYDLGVKKWVEEYCRENGIKVSNLTGYGECPDEVLYPYGCYDADVSRRLAIGHINRLTSDEFGNNCWEAYWINLRAAIPCLEINRHGILLDKDRVDELTSDYMDSKEELVRLIREWAKWPELNLDSRFQVAELLFGEQYNGHDKLPDGTFRRLRPKGARTVGALPVLTTDKRPKPWTEVMLEKKEDDYTAGTNKQVLGMLLHTAENLRVNRLVKGKKGKPPKRKWVKRDCREIVGRVRDYRFISQVLKSVLRYPDIDDEGRYVEDKNGNRSYCKGLAGSVCSDGRVRTFISQLKETGRWSSARPPLQNISKRRESDYKRILGDRYKYAIRSIFMADPDHVIIEVDYKGAELYGMAIMSNDEAMIAHAQRNLLDEGDPNYYDIHSAVAVQAFNLDCPATKKGLDSLGMKHIRVVAKSVIFGIAYGRGAKAIAIAAKEEGVDVTQEDAQKVIDAIFQMYPGLIPFFESCRLRAVDADNPDNPEGAPRWMCSAFGRFRRFPETEDRKTMGDMERQAQNFPIQNLVADAVSRAIDHCYEYRKEHPELKYHIILQIHDALIFSVYKDDVARFVDEVMPACMVDSVPINPCTLDGMPIEDAPAYYFGFDAEPFTHWGVGMLPGECFDMEFDPKYAGWHRSDESDVKLDDGSVVKVKHEGGWVHSEGFFGKVWLESDKRLHNLKEMALAL